MTPTVQVTAVAQAAANPWWADYVKTIMAAAVGAVATVGAAWLGKRRHPKAVQAEMSDQIAGAFQKLVDELQEENGRHLASIKVLREDAHRLRNQLTKLQAFAASLFKHIAALEAQLRSAGLEPMARPTLPDPATLN